MKVLTIHTVWHASTTVEVPDDYELPDVLDDMGDDIHGDPIVDQLTTDGASLADWH